MVADAAKFWDKRADKYAKQPIRDLENYERTLERTRAHLGSGDRVLELGSGTGTTALKLAPHVGSIVGSDIASRMVEIAREKCKAEGVGNVRFEQATADDFDPAEQIYDVVLAFNFIHLLDDIPGALRKIHALIEPGGLFISKTICLGGGISIWRVLLSIMKPLGLAPNVEMMSAEQIEGLIRDAGFEIVETGDYPQSPRSRFVVARRA